MNSIQRRLDREALAKALQPDWEGAEYRGHILGTTPGGARLFNRSLCYGVWHGEREAEVRVDPPNWEFFIPVEIHKAWKARKEDQP